MTMGSIEQRINYQLNKFPIVKRVIKRCYQLVMYTFSSKKKFEGNIIRVSPDDGAEYFLDIMISLLGIYLVDICFVCVRMRHGVLQTPCALQISY